MDPQLDHAGVRFPPPLLYLGALIAGFAGDWLLRNAGVRRLAGLGLARPVRFPAGFALAAVGLVLMIAGARLFLKAGTNIRPDRPASRLMTSGIYRFTRNPMYLGMTILYAGLALAFDSLIAFLLLPIVLTIMQTQVIAREERYLEARFGDDFRSYREWVRRWL